MRDETDLNGLKLDHRLSSAMWSPDKLMQKLFRINAAAGQLRLQLQHSASRGTPRVCGVARDSGRVDGLAARMRPAAGYTSTYRKKKEKLHLLNGLKKILLDIDQRHLASSASTERESDVVPNLMIGFGIDQVQAEYVAEIKLRNINQRIHPQAAPRRPTSSNARSPSWRSTLASRRKAARDHHFRSWSR